MSQTHQIRITKSNVIHVQILLPKWKKTEKVGNNFWLTKRDNERITDRDRFKGLHIGARGIINRDSFGDFKSGQYSFKSLREDGGGWGRGRYWKSV